VIVVVPRIDEGKCLVDSATRTTSRGITGSVVTLSKCSIKIIVCTIVGKTVYGSYRATDLPKTILTSIGRAVIPECCAIIVLLESSTVAVYCKAVYGEVFVGTRCLHLEADGHPRAVVSRLSDNTHTGGLIVSTVVKFDCCSLSTTVPNRRDDDVLKLTVILVQIERVVLSGGVKDHPIVRRAVMLVARGGPDDSEVGRVRSRTAERADVVIVRPVQNFKHFGLSTTHQIYVSSSLPGVQDRVVLPSCTVIGINVFVRRRLS